MLGWLLGVLASALLILWAPLVPQWGHLHQAHAKERWQKLHAGETLRQTFGLEYPRVDAVALWVAPGQHFPSGAQLEVAVSESEDRQVVAASLDTVLSDGLLIAKLAEPIEGGVGETATIEVALLGSLQSINVQFQIDETKYPEGEMSYSRQSVKGDIAFQVYYSRYALGAAWKHYLFAALVVVTGFFVAVVLRRSKHVALQVSRQDVWVAIAVGAGFVAFYAWWLLFWPGVWAGPGDFTKDVSYIMASQQAVSASAWPTWSHLMCGGMPLLGNPESNTLSLGTLFSFVLPYEKSLWLMLALEAGIGGAGVYVLGRMWGLSRIASVLAAVIGIGSAAYPYRIGEGFSMIGGAVAFMPWVLVGWWQMLRKHHIVYAALAGLSMAAIFWRGEVHILTALLLCLMVWAVVAAVYQGRRAVIMLLCVASIFFLAASPKFLAYMEQPTFFSHQYKPYVVRLIQDGLLDDVVFHIHSRFYPIEVRHGRSPEEWANFGSYVGIVPLVLALVGICTRRREWWIVSGGILLAFIVAEGTVYDLWLRHLGPLAGLLRLPVRGMALVLIWLGLLSGAGLDSLRHLFSSRRVGYILVCAITLTVGLDLAAAGIQVFAETVSPRTQAFTKPASSAVLARHDNGSVGGIAHASVLLSGGLLLPKLCADILAEPEFAKHMPTRMAVSAVPTKILPNHIQLTPHTPTSEYDVWMRFDSAWVSPQAFVVAGSQGQMRVIPVSYHTQVIDLFYIHALTRVEQLMLVLVLVFVVIIGMILFYTPYGRNTAS